MKYMTNIELPQSPASVFKHLIRLDRWWPEDFEGDQLQLDTEFVLQTGDGHYSKNKVIEFVPGQKLVWLTTESLRKADNFDWTGTTMCFELAAQTDHTRLQFTYDGPVLDNEVDRLADICDLTVKTLFYNYISSFTTTITVLQSPQEVFTRITRDVAKWWGGPDLSGNTTESNDEFVVHHRGAHFSRQKIVELIPNEKLVWLVTESQLDWLENDPQEWTNTHMIFELTTTGQTELHFRHQGLTPEKECYAQCKEGWHTVIKDYLFNLITHSKPHF